MWRLVPLGVLAWAAADAHVQYVAASGTLLLANRTAADLHVQLWERDIVGDDDFLNETRTDTNGQFRVTGRHNEVFGEIEPYLKLQVSRKGKGRWMVVDIPRHFIEYSYNDSLNNTFALNDFELDN